MALEHQLASVPVQLGGGPPSPQARPRGQEGPEHRETRRDAGQECSQATADTQRQGHCLGLLDPNAVTAETPPGRPGPGQERWGGAPSEGLGNEVCSCPGPKEEGPDPSAPWCPHAISGTLLPGTRLWVSVISVTEQTWGGVHDILLPNGTPLCSGGPRPIVGSPCPPPGKDVSQCQRLVKRKGIIYSKRYTDLDNDLLSSLKSKVL